MRLQKYLKQSWNRKTQGKNNNSERNDAGQGMDAPVFSFAERWKHMDEFCKNILQKRGNLW